MQASVLVIAHIHVPIHGKTLCGARVSRFKGLIISLYALVATKWRRRMNKNKSSGSKIMLWGDLSWSLNGGFLISQGKWAMSAFAFKFQQNTPRLNHANFFDVGAIIRRCVSSSRSLKAWSSAPHLHSFFFYGDKILARRYFLLINWKLPGKFPWRQHISSHWSIIRNHARILNSYRGAEPMRNTEAKWKQS